MKTILLAYMGAPAGDVPASSVQRTSSPCSYSDIGIAPKRLFYCFLPSRATSESRYSYSDSYVDIMEISFFCFDTW